VTRARSSSLPMLLLATGGVLLAGCSLLTDFAPGQFLEQTEERCSDGVDNDGDGLVDCADTDCKAFDFCKENSEARCSDGVDNDADSLTDCADPDCCAFDACVNEPLCGERSTTACTDGKDNDSNGLTDCADFSCTVSACCQRLTPILEETFTSQSSGCTPIDCASHHEECCCKSDLTYTPCNAFDSSRWTSWGTPPPVLTSSGFSPNQPCQKSCTSPTSATCFSGLSSSSEVELAPSLHLEFTAQITDDPTDFLAVGFVEKAILPDDDKPCSKPVTFPMLIGVVMTPTEIQAVVGSSVLQSVTGLTKGKRRILIEASSDGTIGFYRSKEGTVSFPATTATMSLFYTSPVKLAAPYSRVRLLLQGHSLEASIGEVFLGQHAGCPNDGAWSSGPQGPRAILTPSSTKSRFDSKSVSSPSILLDGSTHRLYYTGVSSTGESAIGVATSKDGVSWTRPEQALTITGDDQAKADPCVILYSDKNATTPTTVYLMAYRSLISSSSGGIALATSKDGDSWTSLGSVVTPGASGDWDDGGLEAPMILEHRSKLFLWYIGRRSGSLPAMGLATQSGTGYTFTKYSKNPILKPGTSASDDRGVTDPWIIADGSVLRLWYVGLVWGGTTQVNYAASEDGKYWVRYPKNPVAGTGQGNLFGDTEMKGPTVLEHWGVLHMWYGGTESSGVPAIGYGQNSP
jgi:hypothetical protein